MRSGATATLMDKAIDTLSLFLYFSLLVDNNYPYIPTLDQPLSSDTMLEVLRID